MPKRRKAVPLIPPNHPSRKQARRITTLFHKYTRQLDAARANGDQEKVETLERNIVEMGGRPAYQRASQVSTSYFSTSKKWVLGVLGRNGWLHGIKVNEDITTAERKKPRRVTRLLEVGAINTDLVVDATQKYPLLSVRSIDLNSMHPAIEEADFLQLPLEATYDVLVCSMVLNCVTTASDRGRMMLRLSYFLENDGILFLTIPKSCLTLASYMSIERFQEILKDCGFEITEANETPKISFFQCKKVANPSDNVVTKWNVATPIYRGKKYRNDFAVTFNAKDLQIIAET
jgi:25S rRNA (adenine2142-N1)-methyltransferase